jgi:hypothetical protein
MTTTTNTFDIVSETMQSVIDHGAARQKSSEQEANSLFASTIATIAYMNAQGKGYTIDTRNALAEKLVLNGVPVYTKKTDKKGVVTIKENAGWIRGRTVWNSKKAQKHFKGLTTIETVTAAMPDSVKSFGQFKAWCAPAEKALTKDEQAIVEAMAAALATLADWSKLDDTQQDAAKRSCEQTVRNTLAAIVKASKPKASKPKSTLKNAMGTKSNNKSATA